MSFSYQVEIKESHLDMLGHVNNAVYLQLYEEARWELITQKGYGLKDIIQHQKSPIVLEANLKFLKEITLREKITITFEVLGNQRKIIKVHQKMIKEDGTIASEVDLTIGFFDLVTRKLIMPTPEWLKALE